MPRSSPNFEELSKIYLDGLEYIIPIGKFNVNTAISIKCINGHSYKLSITKLKMGIDKSCPHCKKEEKFNKDRIPYSFFEEYAKKNNLVVVSNKEFYSRWNDSIIFKCVVCGEEKQIKSLNYFENNLKEYKCDGCSRKKIEISEQVLDNFAMLKNTKKVELVDLPETICNVEKIPVSLLGVVSEKEWHIVEYNGQHKKGKFICKICGNIKECFPCNLIRRDKTGRGCNSCRLSCGKENITIKLIKICEDNNLLIEKPYEHILTPIKFICKDCGNRFEKSWVQINANYEKVNCNCKKTNRGEQNEVLDFLKSIYVGIMDIDSFKIIPPKQLDIYLPDLKLAIEYCGNIWHSSKYNQNYKTSHRDKYLDCEKIGIKLITIFSDEWKHKREIVESRIKNAIGLSKIIYARKCEVREIDNKDALTFCDKYHIQGKGQSNIAYGLYYENNLASVMTFSKPSISKHASGYDWELNRFCSIFDTSIVGGASKLLKAFTSTNKGTIISFCDLKWGDGKVYEKLGMQLVKYTNPNYYYISSSDSKRMHRFNFRKNILIEKYGADSSRSEVEICRDMGFYQIYDCGHKKFSLTV